MLKETTLENINTNLRPILKWAGGKDQELKYILPNMPFTFENYYEPFVGGGAVYTAINSKQYFINDKSEELISLYKSIAITNTLFFETLEEINHNWTVTVQDFLEILAHKQVSGLRCA